MYQVPRLLTLGPTLVPRMSPLALSSARPELSWLPSLSMSRPQSSTGVSRDHLSLFWVEDSPPKLAHLHLAPTVLSIPRLPSAPREGGLALEGAEAQGGKEKDPRILQKMTGPDELKICLVPGTVCKVSS